MPEIVLKDSFCQVCTTLQLVYELALTERLEPDPVDWRAGELEYRAEHGLSAAKLRRHKRGRYGTMIEILFLARRHKLLRLFNQRYVPTDPDVSPPWGWWFPRGRRCRVLTSELPPNAIRDGCPAPDACLRH
jgi:hypothetical protein